MSNYRTVLKKRRMILIASIIILVLIQIVLLSLDNRSNSEFVGGAFIGFQSGLLFGIIMLAVVMSVRYTMILRDETKLKMEYNMENDERRIVIKQKSGGNVLLFSSVIIIISGVIAGYYNEVVFLSLSACGIFQLTFGAILKMYYLKKY